MTTYEYLAMLRATGRLTERDERMLQQMTAAPFWLLAPIAETWLGPWGRSPRGALNTAQRRVQRLRAYQVLQAVRLPQQQAGPPPLAIDPGHAAHRRRVWPHRAAPVDAVAQERAGRRWMGWDPQ